jgi:ATP-dependent DNA helicase RecG
MLIVIEVEPYPVPPIVEVDAVPWVRVGPTTRRANQADLLRLLERRPARSIPFDTRPLEGATLMDLDTTKLQASWTVARDADADPATFPTFDAWLDQRQLGRVVMGVFVPNAAAVLLHGRSPQDLLPAASVDAVRYSGRDVAAPVASRRLCTGSLTDQLDVAWAWIASHVESVPAAAVGIRQTFVPNYPLEALKELVRNLVQHRLYEGTNAPGRIEWFDDRIEFGNPGGPFGRASEGEFGSNSDYRNPLVTKGLVEAGYVQQLGRGIRRVRLLLEANGNPPLEASTDGFTRVVVRRRP